jgi:hypothetical protein
MTLQDYFDLVQPSENTPKDKAQETKNTVVKGENEESTDPNTIVPSVSCKSSEAA